jgi:hypothetical protein
MFDIVVADDVFQVFKFWLKDVVLEIEPSISLMDSVSLIVWVDSLFILTQRPVAGLRSPLQVAAFFLVPLVVSTRSSDLHE